MTLVDQRARFVVGAGLKMYLDMRQTVRWAERVADIADRHPAVSAGVVDLFVLPSFTALAPVLEVLGSTRVKVGAQDLFWEDRGPYTGEVSGADLADLGCTLVEVGHAERRSLFYEDEDVVAAKTFAAFRNKLVPVLCLGEALEGDPEAAAEECGRQLASAIARSRLEGVLGPLVLAYEPQWAIGAPQPASAAHIITVVSRLREAVDSERCTAGSTLLYGGTAGTGMLPALDGAVGGLFLGRSCHDPNTLEAVLDEAWQLV